MRGDENGLRLLATHCDFREGYVVGLSMRQPGSSTKSPRFGLGNRGGLSVTVWER